MFLGRIDSSLQGVEELVQLWSSIILSPIMKKLRLGIWSELRLELVGIPIQNIKDLACILLLLSPAKSSCLTNSI